MIPATPLITAAKPHAERLASKSHADRAAALSDVRTAINEAADREAASLKKQVAALERARAEQLEAASAAAEQARRARAASILVDALATGEGSLTALVAAFRKEPSRALATAIRSRWDVLNVRAHAELGGELSTQILGGIFADDILAQPECAGAVNLLWDPQFGANDRVLSALYHAVTWQTPGDIQSALERVETEMLQVAQRGRSMTPDPDAVASHALRRAHATDRDIHVARAQLGEEQGARRQAEFARTYQPPPQRPPSMLDGFRDMLANRGLLSGRE